MKQLSLNSLRTIVYSNLFLSLCPVALIVSTYLIMENSIERVSIELLLFVFFSSLLIYNLNVVFASRISAGSKEKISWITSHLPELKWLFVLSLMGTIYSALFISISSILFLVHLFLLSILYVLPIKIGRRVYSLRKFPLVKIFILTYVWTSVTVVIPCIESGISFNLKAGMLIVERFLFIFALAMLFDIRDIEHDKKTNLITLPGLLGIKYAVGIPKLLVGVFVFVSLITEGFSYVTIGRIVLASLTLLIIEKAKKQRIDLFYLLGVDGLMIIQFLILILLWTLFR